MAMLTRRATLGALAAACSLPTVGASASGYPDRQITIVVPYAAGGPADAKTRIIAERLRAVAGVPVIIENVVGVAGIIGTKRVAQAAPDGYVVGFGLIGTHGTNPAFYPDLAYDPEADFVPIIRSTSNPVVLIVRNDLPGVTDFASFLRVLKERGSSWNYGTAGVGGPSHLACLRVDRAVGGKARDVAYRGSGPAVQDLIGGRLHFMCEVAVGAVPAAAAGQVRALAVLSPQRLDLLPDVPSIAELGYPELAFDVWDGYFVPKGTAPQNVARLHALFAEALDDPRTAERLRALGAYPISAAQRSPEAFRAFVSDEVRRWREFVRAEKLVAN